LPNVKTRRISGLSAVRVYPRRPCRATWVAVGDSRRAGRACQLPRVFLIAPTPKGSHNIAQGKRPTGASPWGTDAATGDTLKGFYPPACGALTGHRWWWFVAPGWRSRWSLTLGCVVGPLRGVRACLSSRAVCRSVWRARPTLRPGVRWFRPQTGRAPQGQNANIFRLASRKRLRTSPYRASGSPSATRGRSLTPSLALSLAPFR